MPGSDDSVALSYLPKYQCGPAAQRGRRGCPEQSQVYLQTCISCTCATPYLPSAAWVLACIQWGTVPTLLS